MLFAFTSNIKLSFAYPNTELAYLRTWKQRFYRLIWHLQARIWEKH